MRHSTGRSVRSLVGEACVALIAYGALAWLVLYPMFAAPAREVFDPSSRPDGWLTVPVANWAMWAMAWGSRILTTAPAQLFEANIFHPTPDALATSQPLLGQLVLFAPVYGATGNMVLAYQMNLLAALALCGATMFTFLRHWGVGRPAAFFGGFVYLFCPVRLTSLTHVQIIAAQYVPLILLFLDKALMTGRWRYGVGLLVFAVLQVLCSEELASLTAIALLGYAAGVLWKARAGVSSRGIVAVLVATLVAMGVAYVLRLPRLHLVEAGLIAGSDWFSWARLDSAGWLSNYVVPPFAHRRWVGGPVLYVGMVPLLCSVLAFFAGNRQRTDAGPAWKRSAALGVIITSYLMALGPVVDLAGFSIPGVQGLAAALMPDFATVVTPARFGSMLMVGIAALAGVGLEELSTRLSRRGWVGSSLSSIAVVALLTVVTFVEYELPFEEYPTKAVEAATLAPPVYRSLAERPNGAVLEVPAVTCDLSNGELESVYTARSASHWQPLLNGYGSRTPLTQGAVVALAESLPDAGATEVLQRMTGLRYVVVHLSRLRHADRSRWISPAGLELAGFFGSDLLFEVTAARSAVPQGELTKWRGAGTTLLGTPLAALPPQARKARLAPAGALAEVVSAGLEFKVPVLVVNESDRTWPALAWGTGAEQRVQLAYRWEDEEGNILAGSSAAAPLPYDLESRGSLIASLCVPAPSQPGAARLVIGLAQGGEWFPDTTSAIPVDVVPLGF